MAASLPRDGEWVQGTALEAVIPPVKILGKLACYLTEMYLCTHLFFAVAL